MKIERRGFLKLMGGSAAVPAAAAIPLLSAQATPQELATSYNYEMKKVVPEGMHVRVAYAADDDYLDRLYDGDFDSPGTRPFYYKVTPPDEFMVSGCQPLSVILQDLQNRSESKYTWVLTKLEPAEIVR